MRIDPISYKIAPCYKFSRDSSFAKDGSQFNFPPKKQILCFTWVEFQIFRCDQRSSGLVHPNRSWYYWWHWDFGLTRNCQFGFFKNREFSPIFDCFRSSTELGVGSEAISGIEASMYPSNDGICTWPASVRLGSSWHDRVWRWWWPTTFPFFIFFFKNILKILFFFNIWKLFFLKKIQKYQFFIF